LFEKAFAHESDWNLHICRARKLAEAMTKSKILARNTRHDQMVETLLAALARHSDEALNQIPAGGGWSAIQTAHHLLLAEQGALQYVRKKLSAPATFERVGLGARWRSGLLWLAMVSPLKFSAPTNVSGEKLPAWATLADTQAEWRRIRAEWADFFATLPDGLADKAVFKHPRAGRIGWLQMLAFFDAHFNRHLKQIRRAL
jgi:hypothetical protein